MNTKILVVLLLGISFLFFGCAKPAEGPAAPVDGVEEDTTEEPTVEETTEETEETTEETTENVTDEEPETEEETTEEPTEEVSDEELADLFQVDEDEPLGDTGLDGAQTPSSEKEQNTS